MNFRGLQNLSGRLGKVECRVTFAKWVIYLDEEDDVCCDGV